MEIENKYQKKYLKYKTKYENLKHGGGVATSNDLVLHCNSNMSEMMKVANNSPFLNDFIIKKTSQIIKKLS